MLCRRAISCRREHSASSADEVHQRQATTVEDTHEHMLLLLLGETRLPLPFSVSSQNRRTPWTMHLPHAWATFVNGNQRGEVGSHVCLCAHLARLSGDDERLMVVPCVSLEKFLHALLPSLRCSVSNGNDNAKLENVSEGSSMNGPRTILLRRKAFCYLAIVYERPACLPPPPLSRSGR